MSSGCRATTTNATRSSSGRPSSGVWVFMNRRCVRPPRSAKSSSFGSTSQSSHGDNSANGLGRSGRIEDQQRAHHLDPGRTGLRSRADDDVVISQVEVKPTCTVFVPGAVSDRLVGHTDNGRGQAPPTMRHATIDATHLRHDRPMPSATRPSRPTSSRSIARPRSLAQDQLTPLGWTACHAVYR